MALSKSKTLPNGTSGSYWKIVKESYDRVSHVCTWTISLFANRDCGIAGADLGIQKQFSRKLTPEEAAGNRTQLGYSTIKAQANEMVKLFPPATGTAPRDADLKDAVDA